MGEELNNQNYKIYFNGHEMGEVEGLKVVGGVDLATGEDVNVQSFKSVSGKRCIWPSDAYYYDYIQKYIRYKKRVANRQKLYEKKLKLGRRL